MLPEERKHDVEQLVPSADDETMQVLLVVVVAAIDRHRANPEEVPQLLERADTARALNYHEAVGHLVAGLVAADPRVCLLAKATFACTSAGSMSAHWT